MKFSSWLPKKLHRVFEPYNDFNFYHLDDSSFNLSLIPKDKELWIGRPRLERLGLSHPTYELEEFIHKVKKFKATTYMVPTSSTFEESIKLIKNCSSRLPDVKAVGIWQGEKKPLETLGILCDLVALPYKRRDHRYIEIRGSSNYVYLGFKNLDELRRYPPGYLLTSIHIRAASMGISLRERERRLWGLPLLHTELNLSELQIALAIDNLKAIKEAVL